MVNVLNAVNYQVDIDNIGQKQSGVKIKGLMPSGLPLVIGLV